MISLRRVDRVVLVLTLGAALSGCGPSEQLDPSGYSVPLDAQYGQTTSPTPTSSPSPRPQDRP